VGDDREAERLRPPPSERFAGSELVIDTHTALEALRREPAVHAPLGHRQVAVFHHDAVRMILFAFDAKASIPDHEARGTVSIHCLRGRLMVRTAEHAHELSAGAILLLAAGIRHDVVAVEASDMLLTLHLAPARA
jgi:quercetin dioxygenase-like cupin family protein